MRRFRRLPIRARLTAVVVAVFATIFGLCALVLAVNERTTLQQTARESLELTARVVVDRLTDQNSDLHTILVQTTIAGESGALEVIGELVTSDGRVVESAGTTATSPLVSSTLLEQARTSGHWHGRLRLAGRHHDDMVIVVHLTAGAHAGQYLVLAQTLAAVDRTVVRMLRVLGGAAPVTIGIAALGGWIVTGAALRPVDEMTRRAAEIGRSGELAALPVPEAHDELSRLAATLNAMLERLRRSLEMERRFSADASHELRTPIGIMEAELDVALRSRSTPPEAVPVLTSVRDEARALGRIVANLVLLARADSAGEVAIDRRPTDLRAVADTVAGRFRTVAEERGIELLVDGESAVVLGDADLLVQAMANLVENALRYTDRDGSVVLSVSDGGTPSLSVADTGCGIAEADLANVFQRFYRTDGARRRERGGAGLGLEISRRIVEAHGGRIEVTSVPGRGSTFVIELTAPNDM